MADLVTFDYGLYIDGEYFHVPVLSCERTADFIWKYAERNQQGKHIGELLGIYFNYELKFGEIVDRAEYYRLYRKLTEHREYHSVKMPGADGSMFEYQAYFAKVKDSVKKSRKGKNIFKGLVVSFVAQEPAL